MPCGWRRPPTPPSSPPPPRTPPTASAHAAPTAPCPPISPRGTRSPPRRPRQFPQSPGGFQTPMSDYCRPPVMPVFVPHRRPSSLPQLCCVWASPQGPPGPGSRPEDFSTTDLSMRAKWTSMVVSVPVSSSDSAKAVVLSDIERHTSRGAI